MIDGAIEQGIAVSMSQCTQTHILYNFESSRARRRWIDHERDLNVGRIEYLA